MPFFWRSEHHARDIRGYYFTSLEWSFTFNEIFLQRYSLFIPCVFVANFNWYLYFDGIRRQCWRDWVCFVCQLSGVSVMNMNLGCGNQSGSVLSKRHRSLSGQICPVAHVPRFTSHADEDSAPEGHIPPPKTLPVTNLFFFCLICSPRFGKPNSVFKNISASIVLVRERTFYCRPYNVLKVSQFCRAPAFLCYYQTFAWNIFILTNYRCLITVLCLMPLWSLYYVLCLLWHS